MDFVNFHTHTQYSILKSPISPKKLLQKAIKYGYKAIAITELGNMFSVLDFYTNAKGIKPIIGMEAFVDNHRLILIAKDNDGFKNLIYLSSISYLYNFKNQYPIISYNELSKHQKGIAVIANYLESEIGFYLKKGISGFQEAKKIAKKFKNDFEDFYLEIRRDGFKDEKVIEKNLIQISKECNIPLIGASDVWYLDKEDFIYSEALNCIKDNKLLDLNKQEGKNYLKTKDEMIKLFEDLPQAIQNTSILNEKINLQLNFNSPTPLRFKFTKDRNNNEYFTHLCKKGLQNRLKNIPIEEHSKYHKRLEYEIETIINMDLTGYFLIVYDYVNFAKNQNILVGPGRGKVSSSLVAFALNITEVDPLKYNLIFERFLNIFKKDFPNIYIDVCSNNQKKIIKYIIDRYGKENVAQVSKFETFSIYDFISEEYNFDLIREVCKIIGYDNSKIEQIINDIPKRYDITYCQIKNELIKDEPLFDKLFEICCYLEDKIKGINVTSGVVISDNQLWKKIPLCKKDNKILMQYNSRYLEDCGLIEFNLVPVKFLTAIDNSLKNIKKNHNIDINFSTLDMNDKRVFELITNDDISDLFQLEPKEIKQYLKKLKLDCFEELIAFLSLYRPYPIENGMIDDFIERKHNRQKIEYFYDELKKQLEPILKSTYGIILYQEQIIEILHKIGGFSLPQADIIRLEMLKGINTDFLNQKAKEFVENANKQNIDKDIATDFFKILSKLVSFTFIKAHATPYATITYLTAYLKKYYPKEYNGINP